MRIIGIDPGLATTGFAILDFDKGKKKLISCGVIRTAPGSHLQERLNEIYKDITSIIEKHKPKTCAIEQLFFSKNVTTGIQVAHARGIVLLALQQNGIPSTQVTPSALKRAITGDGKADKKAMQKMVTIELNLKEPPKPDDAADAVSLALYLASTLK